MTDKEMIRALQKDSTDALGELIDKYTPYVSSVIFRIIGRNKEDCKELTADVFFALWQNRAGLRADNVKGYLGEIARNKAFNFIRSSKSFLPLEEDIIFGGDSPGEAAENNELSRIMKNALAQLDAGKKELFMRYYYYGQKVREAAADMNINLSTAKMWLKRGREQLRAVLEKEGIR